MRKKLTPYLLLLPQILLSIILLVALAEGIIQSFGVVPSLGLFEPTLKYYFEIFNKPDFLNSLFYSLKISLLSAIIATLIGTLICGFLVMRNKSKSQFMRLIELPVVTPHVVVALFVICIFAQNGLIARIMANLGFITDSQQFPLLIYDNGGFGVIFAYVFKEAPFIVFFIISLMANINSSYAECAQNLGASKWRAFFKITLPMCKGAILSGFLIIFVFSLGSYELPYILGSTTPKALPLVANIEFTYPDLAHRPYAMAINGIIIAISCISAYLYCKVMTPAFKSLKKDNEKTNNY